MNWNYDELHFTRNGNAQYQVTDSLLLYPKLTNKTAKWGLEVYGIGLGYSIATQSQIVGAEKMQHARADSVKLYHKNIAPILLSKIAGNRALSSVTSELKVLKFNNSPFPTENKLCHTAKLKKMIKIKNEYGFNSDGEVPHTATKAS